MPASGEGNSYKRKNQVNNPDEKKCRNRPEHNDRTRQLKHIACSSEHKALASMLKRRGTHGVGKARNRNGRPRPRPLRDFIVTPKDVNSTETNTSTATVGLPAVFFQ